MWTHRSFKHPLQNSGTVSEYKFENLYSGTKVGAYSLGTQCLNTTPLCARAHKGTSARAPSANMAFQREWDLVSVVTLQPA